MPDGIDIKVTGLKEINKDLFKYSQQLGDRVVLASAREGLKVIQKQARVNAPKGKTGRLKRNILIKASKIHSPKRGGNTIGVFLYIRARGDKDDKRNAFYGRFINDGWNTHGKRQTGNQRALITSVFGTKTGRKTLPGKTDVTGLRFIDRAFLSQRNRAVDVFRRAVVAGAEIVKRKTKSLR